EEEVIFAIAIEITNERSRGASIDEAIDDFSIGGPVVPEAEMKQALTVGKTDIGCSIVEGQKIGLAIAVEVPEQRTRGPPTGQRSNDLRICGTVVPGAPAELASPVGQTYPRHAAVGEHEVIRAVTVKVANQSARTAAGG